MNGPLTVGEAAPDFELVTHSGEPLRLSSLRGRQVVLWWYPKASTAGCTLEGQAFRDQISEFEARGAAVIGISRDTPADNAAFAEGEGFPFPLLSDTDGEVSLRYGAIDSTEQSHPRRVTWIIGKDGRLERHYDQVSPKQHASQVLGEL